MKGADIILCTVYLWFLSTLPLLVNMMHLRAVLDGRRIHELASNTPSAYLIKDVLELSVLAFSTAICIFCVQCVRVVWPRIFTGEHHEIQNRSK